MKSLVTPALVSLGALAGAACGGTTGHETLPATTSGGATVAGDGGDGGSSLDADATVGDESIYTGAFDVFIPLADRELPDVQAASEGGSEGAEGGAGGGLPNCPPFLPVMTLPDGGLEVVPLGCEDNLVPADYASDGSVALAQPGSICATYPWLGSLAADRCLSLGSAGGGQPPPLPPCSSEVEAGVAIQGAGAGATRYQLCLNVYQCFLSSGCYLNEARIEIAAGTASQAAGELGTSAIQECFCGRNDAGTLLNATSEPSCTSAPQGACLAQEMAALELPATPANFPNALSELLTTTTTPGYLNYEFKLLINYVGASDCAGFTFESDAGSP